jgi:hypothetical protein
MRPGEDFWFKVLVLMLVGLVVLALLSGWLLVMLLIDGLLLVLLSADAVSCWWLRSG